MSREIMPFGDDPFFSHFFGKGWLTPFFSDSFPRGFESPQMDIEETEKEVIVKMDLPGVDPKNIDLQLAGNQLVISGKSESEDHKERRFGSFQRQISFPCFVDEKHVRAKVHDGVLTIVLPKIKIEEHGLKKIPIES